MAAISWAVIALGYRMSLRVGWTDHGRSVIATLCGGLLAAFTLKMTLNSLSVLWLEDGRLRGTGLAMHYLASAAAIGGALLILVILLQSRSLRLRQVDARRPQPAADLALLLLLGGLYLAIVFRLFGG